MFRNFTAPLNDYPRIAKPDAKLGVTFVGLNLHPGMGCTHFLPKIVGPQVAARMLLTGELISGEQGGNSNGHDQFHYFFAHLTVSE